MSIIIARVEIFFCMFASPGQLICSHRFATSALEADKGAEGMIGDVSDRPKLAAQNAECPCDACVRESCDPLCDHCVNCRFPSGGVCILRNVASRNRRPEYSAAALNAHRRYKEYARAGLFSDCCRSAGSCVGSPLVLQDGRSTRLQDHPPC